MNASTWRLELIINYDRSPSQNMAEFETFVKNLELNLELIFIKNLYLTVVIVDFNAKSHNWYKYDKTTASGTKPEIITSHYGFTQNEPTHIGGCFILYRSYFYISAKFNMVLDSGVHSSLHPNSHH